MLSELIEFVGFDPPRGERLEADQPQDLVGGMIPKDTLLEKVVAVFSFDHGPLGVPLISELCVFRVGLDNLSKMDVIGKRTQALCKNL